MMAAASAPSEVARFHRATDATEGHGAVRGGRSNTGGVRWSDAERALLTAAYAEGGYRAAMRALPGRSEASIYDAAARLGLQRRKRWTRDEDNSLRDFWSWGMSLETIARRLERTPSAVYWRGRHLGLIAGAPPDFEHLTAAALRAGYATTQLRKILAWAGVRVRRSLSRPMKGSRKRRFSIVETVALDEALARWHATEPVECAARRHGVTGAHLRRLLRRAGLIPAPSKTHKHIRVTDDQVRAVLGAAR